MNLYLMRHGPAVSVGQDGIVSDSERTLSGAGRETVIRMADVLLALKVKPETVMASPLVRTCETAELVAERLGLSCPVEEESAFAPGVNYERAASLLGRRGAGDALVVGHAPDMGEFAAYLISPRTDVAIMMRPAAVCCVSFEHRVTKGAGVLLWLLPPDAGLSPGR